MRANTVWDSGWADLALAAPAGPGTCFAGHRFRTSRPWGIQVLYGCGPRSLLRRVGGGDPAPLAVTAGLFLAASQGRGPDNDWKNQPIPPPQPYMPDPLAPPRPSWPTPESRQVPPPVEQAPVDPPSPLPVEVLRVAGGGTLGPVAAPAGSVTGGTSGTGETPGAPGGTSGAGGGGTPGTPGAPGGTPGAPGTGGGAAAAGEVPASPRPASCRRPSGPWPETSPAPRATWR